MLKVYNTLSRKLEIFEPLKNEKVSFYHCGPTVYWTQHIGNMRGMTMADLIRRSLIYLGYEVKFVRNYTDVGHLTSDQDEGEDKMEKGARREGLTPDQIAEKYIKVFEDDLDRLNILEPDFKPHATQYISEMLKMVKVLVDKGYAYVTPKAVYFDISKYPEYNKLNRQDLEQNIMGAGSGDVSDPDKKHSEDFSLWFFKTGVHKNAMQTWESPFISIDVQNGLGFPGWHIECSAMSKALLGNTIDIHMGGIEHIPVHHTNEIAQSECANGVKFVNYWLHNEHLTVDGKKMAKSEGTSYSLSEIIERGYDPMVLRYLFLNAHYRSKQNFTWEAMDGAAVAYSKLVSKLSDLNAKNKSSMQSGVEDSFHKKFVNLLEDDFNIPACLGLVWDILRSDMDDNMKLTTIFDFDKVFGLRLEKSSDRIAESIELTTGAEKILEERQKAREEQDWERADELRKEIGLKFGLEVRDTSEGQKVNKKK